MKLILFTTYLIFITFSSFSQNKNALKIGDQIVYFNGKNWIDSEIVKVGDGDSYMVYTDETKTHTFWAKRENLELSVTQVIETNTEITTTVSAPLYKVGDIIQYQNGSNWIQTEIFEIGDNSKYKAFTDTNKQALFWIDEKDIKLIKTNFHEEKVLEKKQTLNFRVGDLIEFYDGVNWLNGEIHQINSEGFYIIKKNQEILTKTYYQTEIRKQQEKIESTKKEGGYLSGDIVSVYDGTKWIKSEIIQINYTGQFQVYLNEEKTITKWVESKDIK
jgi:uncharacterized protein YkvS